MPIIAQVSTQEVGLLQNHTPIAEAMQRLENFGADIVGLNCRLGPHHMLMALEQIPILSKAYLSAYPNAGLPSYTDGEFHYDGEADYFRKSAHAFRNQGVRLLGGCCGTTPEHIRAFATELKGTVPVHEKKTIIKEEKILVSSKTSKPEFHSSPRNCQRTIINYCRTRSSKKTGYNQIF